MLSKSWRWSLSHFLQSLFANRSTSKYWRYKIWRLTLKKKLKAKRIKFLNIMLVQLLSLSPVNHFSPTFIQCLTNLKKIQSLLDLLNSIDLLINRTLSFSQEDFYKGKKHQNHEWMNRILNYQVLNVSMHTQKKMKIS